jgi:hypothetical protein
MPKKKTTKKTITIETVEEPEKRTVAEKVGDYVSALVNCGHQNMHAEGEVLCILPKGHKGDHSDGKYSWSDAAGTPPRRHA